MRIKVTRKQFLLLLNNIQLISDRGLELETDVRTLNLILGIIYQK